MFGRSQTFTSSLALSLLPIVALAFLACAGGKGLSTRSRSMLRSPGGAASDSMEASEAEAEGAFATQEASAQDPFGRMPVDWPGDIPLHPHGKVADSGPFKRGCYLILLVPSDRATPAGIQRFYVESLIHWESLQVSEDTQDQGINAPPEVTVVAERQGGFLHITAGPCSLALWEVLPGKDRWLVMVGSDPLAVRLSYTPVP